MRINRTTTIGAMLALTTSWTLGCSSLSKSERGVLIGAGAGAAAGAAIGKAAGSTAKGAIIGAAVGGAAGAIIGRQMDKQAEELASELPNATVERVGEGVLVTFDSGILFDFDSDVVKGDARENLTELAASLNRYPESDLMIVGHTDATGSDSYNQSLSERRARAARSFLVSQGVAGTRIQTEGLGESEPIASNDDEAGRSQNRRVEVAIYASEEYRERLMKGN